MESDLIYPNLSYKIVGVLFEVYNDMGHGYQEKYYQRAIAEAFKKNNINFRQQVYIPVRFKNSNIGSYFLDFLVENKIILEIKRGNNFSRKNIEQVYAYLKAFNLKFKGILRTLQGMYVEDDGTKIDVNVGWRTTDSEYLDKVRREFIPRAQEFKPDIIFHVLGHDTAQGDYGDRGLSWDFFARLVEDVKECADRVCEGRYLVGLGGGSRYEIADYITPKIIEILTKF